MPTAQDLIGGVGAGLFASAVTAPIDKGLKHLISKEQAREEKKLREASPHEIAGVKFGERLLHRKLNPNEAKEAQLLFTLGYGIGWGLIYFSARRVFPKLSYFGGLPFALPFFLLCDGVFAPKAKLSPTLEKIPWQFNLKEFANHVIWTASAELALQAYDISKKRFFKKEFNKS